jgi:hypothetical protein
MNILFSKTMSTFGYLCMLAACAFGAGWCIKKKRDENKLKETPGNDTRSN